MLQVKEGDSTVEAGAQFQQMVNVECVQDFTEQPDLNISFYYNGNPTSIKCKLPISINKFIEPTEMTSEVRTILEMVLFIQTKTLSPSGFLFPVEELKSALTGVSENLQGRWWHGKQ